MPLVIVILTSLLTASDQLTVVLAFFFGSLTMAATMVIFATERVEKKLGRRRWKWPNDSIRFGMYLWGFSTFLSLVQLTELVSSLPVLVFYVILYGQIIVCGIALFYTFLTFAFIVNPKSRPPIEFHTLFFGLELALSNGLAILLAIYDYPTFQDVYWTGFTMLVPVAVIASILLLWMDWRERGSRLTTWVTVVVAMSPYEWVFVAPAVLTLLGMRGLL